MNDKRYYWLKLEENYFDLKVQKALRKLPSGSDMLICYLKMQLKYLNKGGLIEHQGIYDDLSEEIALDIDEDVDLVKMTLSVLGKWKVIEETNENDLYIAEMQTRIGSKTDSALRVQRHREKQKMLQCNNDVTNCNSIQEKEIEKEIDIEKEKITTTIYDVVEKNFNRTLAPMEYQKIEEWLIYYDEDIIKYAVEKSVLNNKKTFNYVHAILNNWKAAGYKTINDIKQNEENNQLNNNINFNQPKKIESTPNWMYQDVEQDLATPEEIAKLEELLAN